MARFLAFSVVLATTIAIAVVESRSTAVEVVSVEKQYVLSCRNYSLSDVSCDNMEMDNLHRLYPYSRDCRVFYACIAPQLPPICLECPQGLYFDAKNNICDYSENVSCTT